MEFAVYLGRLQVNKLTDTRLQVWCVCETEGWEGPYMGGGVLAEETQGKIWLNWKKSGGNSVPGRGKGV